ncbi:hypothetical protein PRUPE_2G109900 [Prunus persica]|uniref:Uncharacterized protein n=1 Tax=Prunus persica TaxID=3760 RepID=A0A251QEG2_PRUPE|nr:hypothetical protein PRUPE_2G109900 [Prunus persica]
MFGWMQTKQIRHFMDKARLGNGAPEEVTRESLIAISYPEPEKIITSNLSSGKLNGGKLNGGKLNGEALVKTIVSDGEDKFRSELISISYTQSPEVGSLPVNHGRT